MQDEPSAQDQPETDTAKIPLTITYEHTNPQEPQFDENFAKAIFDEAEHRGLHPKLSKAPEGKDLSHPDPNLHKVRISIDGKRPNTHEDAVKQITSIIGKLAKEGYGVEVIRFFD